MTDYTELIERMRTDAIFDNTTLGNEAADAIEALQAENERLNAGWQAANSEALSAKITVKEQAESILLLCDDLKYIAGIARRVGVSVDDDNVKVRAAILSAVQSLEAERDQMQSKLGDAIQSSAHWQHQCTELQANLSALHAQEPVEAILLSDTVDGSHPSFGGGVFATLDSVGTFYAAPKALTPLTDEQIYNVFAATVEDAEPFAELVGDPIWLEVVEITRAIEAAHGIHAKGVQQ